ncbi:MAG: nitroreductase family protein [Candidatus Lokiarchaeota archaeon]|nr:nitroreductase family protein [Candidatus Lokiarchaeota archaeon]
MIIMDQKSDELLTFIKSRKSVRNFVYQKIERNVIEKIIECGRFAPSGLNNQPWRVHIVIHPSIKHMLAELTEYGGILESAYANLFIFLDLEKGYDRTKDVQAIGAFMQNLLLGAHALNLGAVWIGEILKNKEKVNEIFKLTIDKYELMGIIALGETDTQMEKRVEKSREEEKRPISEFIEWY